MARIRPSRARLVHRIVLTIALLAAARLFAPPVTHAQEPLSLEAGAELIQRECLRAYPPDLLAEMASGAVEIPAEIEDDPKLQEDFFDAVVSLDKGRFYPFLLEDLFDAFRVYVKPEVRFLDLGSGDGRVVFLANMLGADATGIEYEPRMIDVSRRAAAALGEVLDEDRLHLVEGDFFEHSWAEFDVIFYFDLSSFEQLRVRKKLSFELAEDARLLVGHERAPFGGLEIETTFDSVNVYRQPQDEGGFDPNFIQRCKEEIQDLHGFMERWHNGQVEPTEESLARLGESLAPGFGIVVPEGYTVTRKKMIENLRRDWGSWRHGATPGRGTIRVENLRARFIVGSIATMTFTERQVVGGEERAFMNTAIFQLRHDTPHGVWWLHAHETELETP